MMPELAYDLLCGGEAARKSSQPGLSRDDISSSANLANREPGSTTVFTAATIVRRPLAGAVISCRASSIRFRHQIALGDGSSIGDEPSLYDTFGQHTGCPEFLIDLNILH
jgi:hypothetical protein